MKGSNKEKRDMFFLHTIKKIAEEVGTVDKEETPDGNRELLMAASDNTEDNEELIKEETIGKLCDAMNVDPEEGLDTLKAALDDFMRQFPDTGDGTETTEEKEAMDRAGKATYLGFMLGYMQRQED